ncbi:Short-chain dehydrogenase reductase [Hyphodiscus hymeniophilus]|uniref:Short-chain dehydrogenase reductase n=1 Tax=Hyphodiscus hymeniophilus TaxID=353542 RepID=A0A9P6SPT2_9HELO|nr:Short-chain dehydrogenase reductase [Hyphodiscus hymeniophilus]
MVSTLSAVFIVTGAASGVGFEFARILYLKSATVYIAARSIGRADGAIKKLEALLPGSTGRLVPLAIDLADLTSIKPAVERFLSRESRLDGLIHNAGVMEPPVGSKNKHGHDLEIGTHCLGPFVLTNLLKDTLAATAKTTPAFSVRVIWVASLLSLGPPPGGMVFNDKGGPEPITKVFPNYMQSKVGETWLACDFAAHLEQHKVMSVSVIFKPAVYGAYTELYATFSPKVKPENTEGKYVMAWGRLEPLPKDVTDGLRSVQAGGSGKAAMFWEYCERETAAYL